MYNLYNKNKIDGLGGKGVDFYLPIGAILVELQDCSNKLTGIGSNTTIGPTIATPVYSCHWDEDSGHWVIWDRNIKSTRGGESE
jgi:hypothetical protein